MRALWRAKSMGRLGVPAVNINTPETETLSKAYDVDHIKAVERLGCKAIRVRKQEEIAPVIKRAEAWMAEFRVPVMMDIMLERVTSIAMRTEINNVMEFEEITDSKADAPTSIMAMLN